ncbi:MAG TPA: hypothetical protein PK002_13635 [Cellvibrio sp.]|nr:hypothetical protein [Cellvibrio sp.]
MHASQKLSLKLLLSPLVMAALLVAPCAFAKKDLFATEPGAKNVPAAQQLLPASSAAREEPNTDTKIQSETAKPIDTGVSSTQATGTDAKKETQKEISTSLDSSLQREPSAQKELSAKKESSSQKEASTSKEPAAKEPSAIEVQLARLKRNLTKTKNDLFGDKESSEKKAAAAPVIEPQLADSTAIEEETKTEVATISATEAAQRAQTFAEGQVINVRKYHEDDKPRYAVKLLQKNGRMKTINLDAVNGTLIEETSQ